MDTSAMFKENKDDIVSLINEIDKVIYNDEFRKRLPILSIKLKAEIILTEIEKIQPRGNFYSQYQVAWPSVYFKTHHEITLAIQKLRENFNEEAEKFVVYPEDVGLPAPPLSKISDFSDKKPKKGAENGS